MTALTLFVIGWAAWGAIVNIPAWLRLLLQPTAKRFRWIRLGMVLQSIGISFSFIVRGSFIWATGAAPPLIMFGFLIEPGATIVWTSMVALAQMCFVWTSQIPAVPPLPRANWPWRAYLGGTAVWAVIVIGWAL